MVACCCGIATLKFLEKIKTLWKRVSQLVRTQRKKVFHSSWKDARNLTDAKMMEMMIKMLIVTIGYFAEVMEGYRITLRSAILAGFGN